MAASLEASIEKFVGSSLESIKFYIISFIPIYVIRCYVITKGKMRILALPVIEKINDIYTMVTYATTSIRRRITPTRRKTDTSVLRLI